MSPKRNNPNLLNVSKQYSLYLSYDFFYYLLGHSSLHLWLEKIHPKVHSDCMGSKNGKLCRSNSKELCCNIQGSVSRHLRENSIVIKLTEFYIKCIKKFPYIVMKMKMKV